VGLVGVNFSQSYTGYEGDRSYRAEVSPSREAPKAIQRLVERAAPSFEEFLVRRFRVTNVAPFPFAWVHLPGTRQAYSAALLRINNLIENLS